MVDDDDKLDTTPEDAGEENKKEGEQPEDIFAEHELDINSPEDLEAMEDVTFSEELETPSETPEPEAEAPQEEDAMALFDEFMSDEATPSETEATSSEAEGTAPTEEELSLESLEQPEPTGEAGEPGEELFSDIFGEDFAEAETGPTSHPVEESLLDEQSLGYTEDNTATEILEGLPQAPEEPASSEPEPEPETASEFTVESEAAPELGAEPVFETDAFEDINEGQLFDYDPNAPADASSSGDMFASIGEEAGGLTDSEMEAPKGASKVEKISGAIQGMVFGIIDKLPARIRDFLPVKSSSPAPAMPGGGGGGEGGGGEGGGGGLTFKQRRMIRMFSMILLVMFVYSMLRSCTGGRTDKDMQETVVDGGDIVATVTERDEVPLSEVEIPTPEDITPVEIDDIEEISFDEAPATAPAREPQTATQPAGARPPAEQPAAVQPAPAQQTAQPTGPDLSVQIGGQTITESDQAALQGLGLSIPEGVKGLPISLPRDAETLAAQQQQAEGLVTGKLSNLEASLMAIDDRLDELNFQMRDERITRIESALGESSSPQVQAILIQALEKMEDIDQKLSRLNDLQREMRSLDLEMKSIKSDIVRQSAIVGEQQREINQSLAQAKTQQDVPPKMMVQATIPGRAWLRSEYGELLTVIPGDDIPGYGRVISIDAAAGTVVMSSKAVFREE